jgi:membrane-associated phospholipid phosphatase
MAYPSGHTSNIVLVYGLVAYLLSRYRNVSPALVRVLWSAVALLSLTMVVTSLTLNWHWFADLIAGLLIGGVVLQLTAALDTAVPQTALDGGPRQLVRLLRRRLPRRLRHVPPPTAAPPAHAPPVQPRQDA